MPGNTPEAPPAGTLHEATAHDRQQAARDAYRQSVADGRPLTGIELGRMFDRSPRWGTSRIAEVRSEDIPRRNGNTASDRTPSIRNGSDTTEPAPNGNESLPIGRSNGGHDGHVSIPSATGAPAARTNGNHARDATLPIGNDTASPPTPHRNGNGATPSAGAARHEANHRPSPMPAPDDDTPIVTPGVRRITTVAVLAVALVAGVASYDHQRVLADIAGESWRAYLLPLSVDGLIVAASMAMLVRRRAGEPAGALAWCALLLGLTASLAANVVAADPDLVDPVLVSRVVAAWPPVALGISFELSLQQLRSKPTRKANR